MSAPGVIAKLGSAVRGFKEGDRVALNAITPCYVCENCQRGFTSQCTQALGGWKFANVMRGQDNYRTTASPTRQRSPTIASSTARPWVVRFSPNAPSGSGRQSRSDQPSSSSRAKA